MIRNISVRSFYTSCTHLKKGPSKAKSHSSHQWLTRQMTDPFVELAKMKNYRCRSAFKLLEINEKTKILQPGQTVIDCGASPGSWTEIAVNETNANGKMKNKPKGFVIGIDLLSIHPIEGAHLLSHSDFTLTKTQDQIRELLKGRKIDCVLSDMAPNSTGVRSLDQDKIMDLVYNVLRFAILMSSENASLLVKIWDNGNVKKFEEIALRYYKTFKHIKPEASRSDSAEKFLLAKDFRGLENITNSSSN
ncbi:rRNA methyltransferase 2, mitochondrial-like [Contarinia nasturtii]|uniref:rRNA methyltransferase 2, mitochondrial-like n=1 Tax=Contarinia nasturtii TaxID=265458 RepID=UPI0012D3D273|nr:rRNA methyltransferase 2, mitochondrial-like [Contarinia nasturtii]